MPPIKHFTRTHIVDAAFNVINSPDVQDLTARRVAEYLNSSTQPVYSYFNSMHELKRAVMEKIKDMLIDYAKKNHTEYTFLNIGLGVLLFAKKYPYSYRALFLEGNIYKDLILDFITTLEILMAKDNTMTFLNAEQQKSLLDKMVIYTHGLASLICAEMIEDTTQEALLGKLMEVGGSLIDHTIQNIKKSGKNLK